MKTITKYRAEDGSEWETPLEAFRRDELDVEIRILEQRLGPSVDRGRRAVDQSVAALVKADVVNICRRLYPNESVFSHPPEKIHPMSFAGRLLSEVGGPLNRIWTRFCCMADGWEYEQPYYALNPGTFESERQQAER